MNQNDRKIATDSVARQNIASAVHEIEIVGNHADQPHMPNRENQAEQI